MNLKNYLIKNGYRPDLSHDLDKYENTLQKYLTAERYIEFCELREYGTNEEQVLAFIGSDLRFLKLAYSAQLNISISILEEIVKVLDSLSLQPEEILDLGGSDGWAVDFLSRFLSFKGNLNVVDRNQVYEPISKNVNLFHVEYHKFQSPVKHDLIISILGAPVESIPELFQTISRMIHSNGIALMGLRIPNETEYLNSIRMAHKLGLMFDLEHCTVLEIDHERIPFLALRKSNDKLDNSECLKLIRKGFLGIDEIRRIYGFEAKILYEIISKKNSLEKKFLEADDWRFDIELIQVNDIIYRISNLSSGDMLIEYPILIDDVCNDPLTQIKRISNEGLWNNN